MALVFWFFRNTVAPTTGSDAASSTAPDTTRIPMFWATAAGGEKSASRDPIDAPPSLKIQVLLLLKSSCGRSSLFVLFLLKGLVFLCEFVLYAG